MYIERMYHYDKKTDMYAESEAIPLKIADGYAELCAALFCLGLEIGRRGLKPGHFDLDAGRAVVGLECRNKRGCPEYWAIRK